ncbi:hypothetical protein [Rubritalea profundi]|uniref:Uncharacterized protein n=1 Tax=Rubritalea profundi TaxID=1658618 RepID=A0A2S7U267_9BACT|nr:hypothetical protein [Rubritalea profundi]PQJ29088.1 hypothetical protein BSZ32_11690 [Rubritalea profundi]
MNRVPYLYSATFPIAFEDPSMPLAPKLTQPKASKEKNTGVELSDSASAEDIQKLIEVISANVV